MKKHFRYGLFFALGAMLALGFVACGDESSSGPSKNEETGIETEVSSSSENDEAISSSSAKDEKSSSSKKVESSSSTEASSSSTKIQNSSSSVNVKESSSSGKVESSSSKNDVSSSSKKVQSSSSDKPVESSSSAKSSSSSDKSSSSSAKSSSSSDKSSSSSVKSSSSSAKSSSSSLGIPFEIYDCSEHKCVTTIYLNPKIEYGEFLDTRDDQVYRTVKIGEQTWMAQNLNYKMEGSRCLRQGKPSSDSLCSVYGRLYTWEAANNACPAGWRLPSDDKEDKDYEILSKFVEENNHGMAVGTSLKAGKNDIWGFSGMFSGYRTPIGAEEFDYKGYYWTNEAKNDTEAYARTLGKEEDFFGWDTASKDTWFAVRCIKK